MDKPYTVPGGIKLFFEEGFTGVKGFRDFGNLVSTGLESALEKLEHFTNRSGQRQKDAEAVQSSAITLNFTFDEPNAHNLRWAFLGGDLEPVNAGTHQVTRELMQLSGIAAKRTALPLASMPSVTVEAVDGSPTTYSPDDDYVVSAVNSTIARAGGSPPSAIADGEFVMVSYLAQLPAHNAFPVLKSPIIEGKARLLILPTAGAQIWWEIPRVSLSPDGEFSLDDQDWMQAAMTLTMLADTENNPAAPFGKMRTWLQAA